MMGGKTNTRSFGILFEASGKRVLIVDNDTLGTGQGIGWIEG